MTIKPPGLGTPSAPIAGVERSTPGAETDRARGSAFSSSISAPSTQGAGELPPVQRAVNEVAGEIRAGRVEPGTPAIEAVISRMVELQALPGETPEEVSARVERAQISLADDPNFAIRVQRLLDRAGES